MLATKKQTLEAVWGGSSDNLHVRCSIVPTLQRGNGVPDAPASRADLISMSENLGNFLTIYNSIKLLCR